MCDYQGYEFGAPNYPDSVCIDGYLYDADSDEGDGFTRPAPDEEKIPCPKCNKQEMEKFHRRVALACVGINNIRDDLYDNLPVGDVKPFELIKLIKKAIEDLDKLFDTTDDIRIDLRKRDL